MPSRIRSVAMDHKGFLILIRQLWAVDEGSRANLINKWDNALAQIDGPYQICDIPEPLLVAVI